MDASGQTKRPELNVEKRRRLRQESLQHIRAVNEKRQELEYASFLLNRKGDIQGAVRKKRGAEEARRHLNALIANHKKRCWRLQT